MEDAKAQRAALVRGGVVENVIIAGEGFDPGEGCELIAVHDTSLVGPGWTFDGALFAAPAAPRPLVPEAVTARQARLALLGAGKLAHIEQALGAMPGVQGEAARIEWEYATDIRRDSPLIAALAPALGLTEAQVDALFIAAAGL